MSHLSWFKFSSSGSTAGQAAMLHLYPFHFPSLHLTIFSMHLIIKALIQRLVYIQHSLYRPTLQTLFTALHSSRGSLITLLWHQFIPLTVTGIVCATSPVIPLNPSLCRQFCLGSQIGAQLHPAENDFAKIKRFLLDQRIDPRHSIAR